MADPLHYLSMDSAVAAVAFGTWEDVRNLLAVGESEGTLTVWDTKSWRCLSKTAVSSEGVLWLHFAIGGGKLICQARDGVVNIYDVLEGATLQRVRVIRINHMGFCRGDVCGSRVALPHGDAGIKLYGLASDVDDWNMSEALVERREGCTVTAIKFASTAGDKIIAAYDDGEIRLLAVEGGNVRVLSSIRIDDMTPLSIDFAPERGVACGASSKVSSFSIGTDDSLVISVVEDTPSEGASAIAIRGASPNFAAVGCWDNTVRLFSLKRENNLRPLGALKFHTDSVDCVDFSWRNGPKILLAAGSKDGKVSIWDIYNS